MKYTIFSIDDSRKTFTDKLRESLPRWEEVQTKCVNGNDTYQLHKAIKKYEFHIGGDLRLGHLGIWFTVLNSFEHGEIVTFEDDAMLGANFELNHDLRFNEVKDDVDFFSLFIPRDSDHMYTPDLSAGSMTSKIYANYGGVSMHYTNRGQERILDLLRRDGITDQYDNTLYKYAKSGELKGFCSKPSVSDLVYITGLEPSIVQETEFYEGIH